MMESWDNVFGDAPASFEARMLETLASLEEKPVPIRRFRRSSVAAIAAAAALLIFGGTALATDFFSLDSMKVADAYADSADVSATESPAPRDIIALQGFPESNEYKANSEWMAFRASYDKDGSILKAAREKDPTLSDYSDQYFIYSDRMEKKLESIAKKYDLTLHTEKTAFTGATELHKLIRCNSFIQNCTMLSGYVYEDGSFQADGSCTGNGMCYEFQLGRYKKGSFSEVTLNVGSTADYEPWLYTAADGTAVQLFLGPTRSVLMADLPDAFIAINLLGGTEGDDIFMPYPVTKTDLENFAALINFSRLG